MHEYCESAKTLANRINNITGKHVHKWWKNLNVLERINYDKFRSRNVNLNNDFHIIFVWC